jgi:hypothetical protein
MSGSRERKGPGKIWLLLLALSGLGVGVWLVGRRKRKP